LEECRKRARDYRGERRTLKQELETKDYEANLETTAQEWKEKSATFHDKKKQLDQNPSVRYIHLSISYLLYRILHYKEKWQLLNLR
jgi:hypothetical protein